MLEIQEAFFFFKKDKHDSQTWLQPSANIGPLSDITGSDLCNLSYRPTSPGEITSKSQFISSNNVILAMSDNLPHTAQPASIKFRGVVSLQKPLIIDSINEFDGGSGGNFEGGLGDDSETNGIFKCSIFSLFSEPFLFFLFQ